MKEPQITTFINGMPTLSTRLLSEYRSTTYKADDPPESSGSVDLIRAGLAIIGFVILLLSVTSRGGNNNNNK